MKLNLKHFDTGQDCEGFCIWYSGKRGTEYKIHKTDNGYSVVQNHYPLPVIESWDDAFSSKYHAKTVSEAIQIIEREEAKQSDPH